MKLETKESDVEERQPLFDPTRHSYSKNVHHQRLSSRLEWAEASWTRWLYLLSWSWISPLLSVGYTTMLTDDDLDDLPNANKCSILYNRIKDVQWGGETAFEILFRAVWKHCLVATCLRLPVFFVTIAKPLLVYRLVLYIQDHQNERTVSSANGYMYALGLFGCVLVQVLVLHQYYFISTRVDLMIRNLLLSMIFKRLLSVNTATLRQITGNYVINIVTNDVSKFDDFFKYVPHIWEGPLEAVVIFGILYWIIGFWPTLCGYIIFILLVPLQIVLKQQFGKYRERVVVYTDQRIHAFEELIRGFQVIKMYNWEKYMEKHVCQIRQQELATIRRASVLRAINVGLFLASIPLILFATYTGVWMTGRPLTIVEIFITLTFYSQMRFSVTYSWPLAVEKLVDIRLAWRRIDQFIQRTTKQEQRVMHIIDNEHNQQRGAMTMYGASFSWNGQDECLSSVDINIEPGTFVGIAGAVGSGKSSLFAAILGEMIQTNGQIDVHGSSFSYAAQSAWIFADTLRANILFNKPFDENRYRNVLHACCLDIDLSVMGPSRDLTMIGENGVNLSGGQKARVCLARALYVDADIYLLDDPFAAVDRIVAKRIYAQCIGPRGLLRNKTRLLITHQTQFLTEAHQTIVLAQGRIVSQDRFGEVPIENKEVNRKHSNSAEDEEEEIPISGVSRIRPVAWQCLTKIFKTTISLDNLPIIQNRYLVSYFF